MITDLNSFERSQGQTIPEVRTRSPSPVQFGTNSPSPVQLRTNSPSPVQLRTNSPSPVQFRTRSPSPVQLRTNSPSPVQLRTRSPSPHQRPVLQKTTSTYNTLKISSDQSAQAAGPQLHRKDQLQRSRSCSPKSDQMPPLSSHFNVDTSNTYSQQHTWDVTAPDYNKEPGTVLHNQSADHTLMTSSPCSTSPATCEPIFPLPQTNPTSSRTDVVVDPGESIEQLAAVIVKFVLASDNPELRAALKRIVDGDPTIARRL